MLIVQQERKLTGQSLLPEQIYCGWNWTEHLGVQVESIVFFSVYLSRIFCCWIIRKSSYGAFLLFCFSMKRSKRNLPISFLVSLEFCTYFGNDGAIIMSCYQHFIISEMIWQYTASHPLMITVFKYLIEFLNMKERNSNHQQILASHSDDKL